jgi:hypothetical protein
MIAGIVVTVFTLLFNSDLFNTGWGFRKIIMEAYKIPDSVVYLSTKEARPWLAERNLMHCFGF